MKTVIGLGNPGSRYRLNRHNIGFMVVDQVAATNNVSTWKTNFQALVADVLIGGEKSTLIKPQGYMNRSGQAVRQAVDFYKVELRDLLVVCDDFSLPLGKLRMRTQGSSGGQNGLKDIIAQLGAEEFARLRIGIGEPPKFIDPADYVLTDFRAGERQVIDETIIAAGSAVECWCREGIQTAMLRFNPSKSKES